MGSRDPAYRNDSEHRDGLTWDSQLMPDLGTQGIEPHLADASPGPDAIGTDAFHGLAGDLVHAVEESTEADPVAILVTLLAIFGAIAGHLRTFYQGFQQAANLYVALVGDSSTGRKGTAFSLVRAMFGAADPEWERILVPGLASGEGLIGYLKRQEGKEERALVLETEFRSPAPRHGSRRLDPQPDVARCVGWSADRALSSP